ncbi:hypothetical protein DMA12_19325 [Amycolatopsis balhimycina DSM 5908]|uniref:Uncharacterized protein n=1 Tax=Amycolatopsis balhimycina DSM 5908 TaxID=1081091 RepID=A0A428WK13_AMYBA|nr:hypothetical protein [Amycolatopsis balhimycina]RSM43403.1 hypothetical protein DMA12_19325 [Amycolatopsis balhimycina DSM 5908]
MTSEVFEHPALTTAASRLSALRAAAGRLGVPDPVAALRHLDCSPASIRTSASAVDTGALAVTSAQAEFRAGVDRAENGGSTETFGTWADTVDGQYVAAARAAASTAAVGVRIAERLDELASSVSAEVSLIAASAGSSVAAVLAGDRSAEAVSEVSAACTAVIRAVSAKVATLSSLAAELEPLTTPAVELS